MTKQEFIKLYKKYQRYKQSDGDYSKKYKVDRDTLKHIISKIIDKDDSLWNIDLNWLDVSGIEDMSYIFFYSEFNGDISKWDVSNVEDMSSMFDGSEYNRLDFLLWNIKPFISMRRFFPQMGIYSYEDFIKLRKKKLTDPEFIYTYFDKIIKRLCS